MSLRFDNETYLSCYSPRVYKHLTINGFKTYKDEDHDFDGSFLNIKSGKVCHVFLRTPELNECLSEVSNTKK